MNNTGFSQSLFCRFKDMVTINCRVLRDKARRNVLPLLLMSKVVPTKPMCLACHTRSECNSNCSYKYDHVEYLESEYQSLLDWCNTNFHE